MAALLDFTEAPVLLDAESPRVSHDANIWESQSFDRTPREQGDRLLSIDPDDCILWPFSDRPSDELGDIHSLAHSLKEHGQQEPILVRENRQKTRHTYEIIFGNRRWRAAQIAKIKLIAICKNVDDQQASLFQKEENENRKELSDYARAMSYRAQIDGGIYKNEAELSKVLGISKQALNDLMAYLRVPEELREAISNFKSLSKKMVTKLAALSKDKEMLEVLMHLAPKISDQSVTTTTLDKHIHSFLSPGIKKNKLVQPTFEKRNALGELQFRTTLQNTGEVSLHINKKLIDQNQMDVFHLQFAAFLDGFTNAQQK
jgi:ParB/RepB/Spo0J family partition protein